MKGVIFIRLTGILCEIQENLEHIKHFFFIILSQYQSNDYNGVELSVPSRDVTGKKFKTIELVEKYYMSYAKAIGFSVRINILVRNI